MFTGIIEGTGQVIAVDRHPQGLRLRIAMGEAARGVRSGQSVCVSGVCLTAAGLAGDVADFDVVSETMRRSTVGRLVPGDLVNLERSLQADGRLEGHFVQGHVDAVGWVAGIQDHPQDWRLTVAVPQQILPYLVPKGSVAVDGASLTIASVDDDGFTVALIPTTLRVTTLGRRGIGDAVNVETDILARTVHHMLGMAHGQGGLTLAHLQAYGYV